jgi:hypothetical protein
MRSPVLAAAALVCAVAAAAQQATPRASTQIVFGVTVNMTDVYYWPITGEYRADFAGANMPLPGELRVYRGRALAAEVEASEYIYVYPLGLEGEASRLATGDEMKRLIEERAKAVADYDAGKAKAPPRMAYQGPFRGFVLRLPRGRYRLEYRVENRGRSFSLSKNLVVFPVLRRGVRYEVIPAEKWTVSSDSDSARARIYLKPEEVVFLKTFPTLLYNAALYDLMASPNRPTAGLGLSSSAVWVRTEESLEDSPEASLELRAGGRDAEVRPRDWLVRQIPGSALGYDIVEHTPEAFPGVRPSFRAYRIAAPPAGYDVRLALPRQADSGRVLRTVDPRGSGWTALALLLPLAPLGLRAALRARDNRRLRAAAPPPAKGSKQGRHA